MFLLHGVANQWLNDKKNHHLKIMAKVNLILNIQRREEGRKRKPDRGITRQVIKRIIFLKYVTFCECEWDIQ